MRSWLRYEKLTEEGVGTGADARPTLWRRRFRPRLG
jgi:hypothetical protein